MNSSAVQRPQGQPADRAPELGEGLGRRATRGALWTVLGLGGTQALRLTGNLILTRLLFEEAFGLMALMQVILEGLSLFSNIGVGPSIIQHHREDAAFLNTAFTMQCGRGLVLFALGFALSWPMALFYEQPEIGYLLPVVSVTAILSGMNSTRMFTLTRGLAFGRIQVVELASQAVGLVTMVTWALLDRSIWALVSGALSTNLTRAVMSHLYLPGIRNRLHWDRSAALDLIRFGRWILAGTALQFLAGQSDRLIFGKMITRDEKLVTLEMLGVYSIGLMIVMMPSDVLGRVSWNVILPVYSRIVQQKQPLSDVFKRARLPILVLGGWAFSGLIAGGPTAVRLLYDERYQAAGWIVQILAPAFLLRLMEATTSVALLAINRPQWTSVASLAKLIGIVMLMPAGYWAGGRISPELAFPGAVVGYATSEFFRYSLATWAAWKEGIVALPQDLRLTLQVFAIAAAWALAARWMQARDFHVVVESAVIALGVSLAWLPIAWPLLRTRFAAPRPEPPRT